MKKLLADKVVSLTLTHPVYSIIRVYFVKVWLTHADTHKTQAIRRHGEIRICELTQDFRDVIVK